METFHDKVFYVLHMEFDVKGKKLLCNRSDGTEKKLVRFEYHLCSCEGPQSNLLEQDANKCVSVGCINSKHQLSSYS